MIDFGSEELRIHEARLFPTVRIGTEREAELRATASLCAMIKAVSEFGREFVRVAKGPAGRTSCYTEVSFPNEDPDGPELRPDGVIRVVRGKTDWRALLEVKVGDTPLLQEQFDEYHKLAKRLEFDALITISNQAARTDGLPRLSVDRRRLRSVPVFHISWDRLLSEARMLSGKKAIDDPDQHWMLDEWIRYIADPRSKIIAEATLGENFSDVLQAARQGNIRSAVRYLPRTVECWEGYLKKLALRLRAQLGVEVERKLPRKHKRDASGRIKELVEDTVRGGVLTGEFRIPDAVGDVSIGLVLQARAVRYGIDVKPPTEGRGRTRVNWLVRQILDVEGPADMIVRVDWDQGRLSSSGRLKDVQKDITCLLLDFERKAIPKDAHPRRFTLEWTTSLPKGGGRSTGRMLGAIAGDLERFYRNVVERLVPYVPRVPRLPEKPSSERGESQARSIKSEHLPDIQSPGRAEAQGALGTPAGNDLPKNHEGQSDRGSDAN